MSKWIAVEAAKQEMMKRLQRARRKELKPKMKCAMCGIRIPVGDAKKLGDRFVCEKCYKGTM